MIGANDTHTERFLEQIRIPKTYRKQLFQLMGWQQPEDEIFCYDLSSEQLKVLGEWTGRELISPLWDVQLSGVGK
jgi:hypothetical protein